MIVRRVTEADIPAYVTPSKQFIDTTPLAKFVDFDVGDIENFLRQALVNPDVGMWLVEGDDGIVGICGAILYPLYFSPRNKLAQELWWWVKPSARGSAAGRQMKAYMEAWAQERGAAAMFMIALANDKAEKVARLYSRAGYTPLEHTFAKEIGTWQ